jgi:anti-sigma regulatory factor (Ser/Thr protein kinase)
VADLKICAEEHDQVLVIRVSGSLFLPGAAALLAELADGMRCHPGHTVVCDLGGFAVPMTDWVLSIFPAALRRVGGWPVCSLRLAAASPELDHRFGRLRIDRYLPLHATVTDALHQATLDAQLEPHELRLDPDPTALREVRGMVRQFWPHAWGHGRDEAELVADELAANAIRHVGRPFRVAVASWPGQALVAVTDASREEPVPRPQPGGGSSGRGLQVVDRLSRAWGVRLVHGEGKTVWAALPAVPSSTRSVVPRTRTRLD